MTVVTGSVEAGEASTSSAISALVRRSVTNLPRIPASLIPAIAVPVVMCVAYSGTFGDLASLDIIPTDKFVNWIAAWAVLQGSAFSATGASFGVARDLETGFYDRLLVAPMNRTALAYSPVAYGMLRSVVPYVSVLIVVYLLGGGMTDWRGFVTLAIGAVGVAAWSTLWGLGIAYRYKTQRSGALGQVGLFLVLFLTEGQAPVEFMEGWMATAARLNPLTYVLRLSRQGFLDTGMSWDQTWPGLVAIVTLAIPLAWFCWRGYRTVIP